MKSFITVLKKRDGKKEFMNAKQDRQGDAPAVGNELHRSEKKGSSQGDLQAGGQRMR